MSFKGFSIFSSGDHFVQQSRTHFGNFGKGGYEKHFCEIILKSGHWTRRRCLKVFSIFSSGGNFVQRSTTFLAILVKGHKRNTSVKLL